MSRDQCQGALYKLAIAPIVITDDTAATVIEVDRAGYDLTELILAFGTLSDANATIAVELTESDTAGSGHTAVADADLIGTESGMGLEFSDDLKTSKLGYKGSKRYVKATVTPSGNTGNIPVAGIWRLSGAKSLPLSTQTI